MGGKGSGRWPKKGAPIEVPNDDPQEFTVSEKMGNVMELINRMGDQVEAVMLNEWNAERKKKEYLMTIPVEQFSMDYVREQFGGGDYITTFLDESGAACGGGAFTISKKFVGKTTAAPGLEGAPHGAMDPSTAFAIAQMSGHTKGLEMLIASQGVMMEGLLKAMAGRKSEESDPLDVGLRIAEIIKGSSRNDGPSVKEMIGDMAETFKEGIKFGQLAHTPAEKGFADVLEPLIPAVGRALESAANQGRVLASPTPRPNAPSQPEAPSVDLSKAPWLAHLRPFINEIATWAKNGWNPEAYIVSMAARIPDNVLDEIFEASKSPTFIEDALASLPVPFQAYKAWLTKALVELREQVKPETEGMQLDEEEEDGQS
jgi:hypothetical protein